MLDGCLPTRDRECGKDRPVEGTSQGSIVVSIIARFRIAALRMRSEVVRGDPAPFRQNMDGAGRATAAEIAECLKFASHADPMVAKIAAERLLEHLHCCGFVLMSEMRRADA